MSLTTTYKTAPQVAPETIISSYRWPAPSWPERSWFAFVVLILFCGFLFFYGLTTGELYRTESLRAILAEEFLRSGNWIVPTLYGQPLFTKPPGMYAAIALCSLPFGGVSECTARLPSALAATFTVFLWYWHFRRQLGRLAGLIAALILPASFMWVDKTPTAEIDTVQMAWVTAAIVFFLRTLETEENDEPRTENGEPKTYRIILRSPFSVLRSSLVWWLAALLCVAGGVLTKWTAPAFFYMTVIPLLWWRGRLRLLWSRNHLVSAAVGASLCFGWVAWAVMLAGWEPFSYTVGREALMRILPQRHPRPYPWGETLVHPFALLAANLPWAFFAILAFRRGFAELWDERGRRLLQALHCWVWPSLLFWSVIPEHAARHSFPLFPGVAGLAAMVWIAWLTGKWRWPIQRWSAARTLIAMLLIWLVLKVVFIHAVVPLRNRNREPRTKGEMLAKVVPAGETLYLFKLKDEGIMFYYGRPVRRLSEPKQLPARAEPLYCILDEAEWQQLQTPGEAVLHLRDEQGAPIVLVRMRG